MSQLLLNIFTVCTMSNYSEWKLDDLKRELRKRSVKVSGKKAELVERLTYLDSVGRRGTEPEPGLCALLTFAYVVIVTALASIGHVTHSARSPVCLLPILGP